MPPGLPVLAPATAPPSARAVEPHSISGSGHRERTKHKNITSACSECRRKKQKCNAGDRNGPCELCTKNGTACKFDLSTDGRRKWHSKIKEARTQQQLLGQILDVLRSDSDTVANQLLAVIRSGASYEDIGSFVDASQEDADPTGERGHVDQWAEGLPPTSSLANSSTSPSDRDALKSSLREHRNLLKQISNSGQLTEQLVCKVDQLLSQGPVNSRSASTSSYETWEMDVDEDDSARALKSSSGTQYNSPNLIDPIYPGAQDNFDLGGHPTAISPTADPGITSNDAVSQLRSNLPPPPTTGRPRYLSGETKLPTWNEQTSQLPPADDRSNNNTSGPTLPPLRSTILGTAMAEGAGAGGGGGGGGGGGRLQILEPEVQRNPEGNLRPKFFGLPQGGSGSGGGSQSLR